MLDLTELAAVNIMLQSIGETAVTSLSGTLPTDVSTAQTILSEIDAEFQHHGWSFNTRRKVTLSPSGGSPNRTYLPYSSTDGDQVLPVPLKVIPRKRSQKWGIRRETSGTPRKWYLYDIVNDTDVIGKDIDVDLTVGLGFEELPHPARVYIARSAARHFAERVLGEPSQILRTDERNAFANFQKYEAETMDLRMTDSYGIHRAVGRPSPYDDYNS